jgi:hypothetical protein
MGDDRNRILDLLASGRITVEEATRLLDALDAKAGKSDSTEAAAAAAKTGWPKFFAAADKSEKTGTGSGKGAADTTGSTNPPKYMYVKVVSQKGDNVNVKIPLGLLKAGLKLTALIPKPATEQINKAMAEKGMDFDINNLKPQDLEELVEAMREMEIEVDSNNGDTVRVYAA